MANFFKDYQKQVREKRQAEQEQAQARQTKAQRLIDYLDDLPQGAKVKINPLYDPRRSDLLYTEDYKKLGIMYFASRLSDDSVLLSTDKQEAKNGYGHIYSIFDIIA